MTTMITLDAVDGQARAKWDAAYANSSNQALCYAHGDSPSVQAFIERARNIESLHPWRCLVWDRTGGVLNAAEVAQYFQRHPNSVAAILNADNPRKAVAWCLSDDTKFAIDVAFGEAVGK